MFRLTILLRKRRNQVSEIGDFVFGPVGVLLTIQHRLRRGFDRKKRSQTPDVCDMSAILAGGQTCPD